MKKKWFLKVLPISDLKEYNKNPRSISKKNLSQIQELIEDFGFISKPICNADLTVIGGNQRIKILKKMKVNEIECWVSENQLTDEEVKRLCVGLNKFTGEWDYDILANEFELNDLLKWGFSENELFGISIQDDEKVKTEKKDTKEKCCPQCGYVLNQKKSYCNVCKNEKVSCCCM